MRSIRFRERRAHDCHNQVVQAWFQLLIFPHHDCSNQVVDELMREDEDEDNGNDSFFFVEMTKVKA